MRAPGKQPQGLGREAPARTEPRRRERPKGPPIAAPRWAKPSNCESAPGAQTDCPGNYPMAHRGPVATVPPRCTHTPLSPEPQAPANQQLTKSGVAPGSKGTLQGWVEEFLYPLKPVGNTGEFWPAPTPGDLMGGGTQLFQRPLRPARDPRRGHRQGPPPRAMWAERRTLGAGCGNPTPIQTAPSSPSGKKVAPRMARVERSPRSPWVATLVYV